MLWRVPIFISKRMEPDTVDTGMVSHGVGFNDWHERMALADAIDRWLARRMDYVDSKTSLR